MKFTLNAINQAGIVEAGLDDKTDIIDWVILDYIFDWRLSPKATSLNGMVWVSYKHLMKEIPLLGIKDKGAISRRFKKLKHLGLIETYQNDDDMRLYAKTTDLYYWIIKFSVNCGSPVDSSQHPLTSVNTPVDLKQHPVDERQHSTVSLNNSNTIEQIDTYVVSEKPEKVSVQEIVDIYHNTLPTLPKVLKINEARKKKIKALCKEDLPTLESWTAFFKTVSQSNFLLGKTPNWNGCDFEWLINPANALKVAEGRYRNKRASDDDMSWMEGLV